MKRIVKSVHLHLKKQTSMKELVRVHQTTTVVHDPGANVLTEAVHDHLQKVPVIVHDHLYKIVEITLAKVVFAARVKEVFMARVMVARAKEEKEEKDFKVMARVLTTRIQTKSERYVPFSTRLMVARTDQIVAIYMM